MCEVCHESRLKTFFFMVNGNTVGVRRYSSYSRASCRRSRGFLIRKMIEPDGDENAAPAAEVEENDSGIECDSSEPRPQVQIQIMNARFANIIEHLRQLAIAVGAP